MPQVIPRILAKSKGQFDLVVVGGGIVGVASARELAQRFARFSNLKMAILEKESSIACHQSNRRHNSGVIHAGIYYKPGSLKAKLCVDGMQRMYKYAEEKKIPHKKVGKLIVATKHTELPGLQTLYERGIQNEVRGMSMIEGNRIADIEPNCVGIQAIWSPETGIIDYQSVAEACGRDFTASNGAIITNFKVAEFRESDNPDYPVEILANDNKSVLSKYVLCCGGLYSDQLAIMAGCSELPKIVPFRGEYLILKNRSSALVNGNIYPVPDPRLPFLGVHFTPRVDGSIWLGPNAVLAFRREGYKWTDINMPELIDAIRFRGFSKLAAKYIAYGAKEMTYSLFLNMQVKQLQRFVPSLKLSDVERGPSGVRAQALDEYGGLVDDFVFDISDQKGIGQRILHCRNAPSPGATSSLAIAVMIADKVTSSFFATKG